MHTSQNTISFVKFQIINLGKYIENNSSYGDVIMMTVRGQAEASIVVDASGPNFDFLRKLGVDQLDECILFPGF